MVRIYLILNKYWVKSIWQELYMFNKAYAQGLWATTTTLIINIVFIIIICFYCWELNLLTPDNLQNWNIKITEIARIPIWYLIYSNQRLRGYGNFVPWKQWSPYLSHVWLNY